MCPAPSPTPPQPLGERPLLPRAGPGPLQALPHGRQRPRVTYPRRPRIRFAAKFCMRHIRSTTHSPARGRPGRPRPAGPPWAPAGSAAQRACWTVTHNSDLWMDEMCPGCVCERGRGLQRRSTRTPTRPCPTWWVPRFHAHCPVGGAPPAAPASEIWPL